MAITSASQAKQFLKDHTAQMQAAASQGIHQMASLASKGRKIIEGQAQEQTGQAAEEMLGEL